MMNMNSGFKLGLVLSAIAVLMAQKIEKFPLNSLEGLEPQQMKAEHVYYRGRDAIHLSATGKTKGEPVVILTKSDFENGTIELDIAGAPPAGASDSARGSVGIAFHLKSPTQFECFYLRMTNARADDQVRRNHTLQYISVPDFPFERTRAETPGLYESYADLEAGVWTKLRIVVSGPQAKLYINGSDQPSLIVNDLKLGKLRGKVALWSGRDADGYFSNLRVY
jgi:hypothetical protein